MTSGEIAAPVDENTAPFLVSNEALEDGDELRRRMARDGYLFFQGLIPGEAVLATRAEILALCEAAGWLAEGTERREGIAAPDVCWVEPQPEFMQVYNRILCGEQFNAFSHAPTLLAMLEHLFGETPLPHPRNIARILFPHNTAFTTPAHQDYIHIQGTKETYTAWIPLGDCPRDLGSLIVLAGSHQGEILPVHKALGAGGVGIATEALPFQWTGSDFALGDVLLFHSMTVHKALPNLSADRIRLSVDFRYQPLSHPIEANSLEPHYQQLAWEAIYQDWKSARYQYYWKSLPIRLAERDQRVTEIRQAATPAEQGE